MKKKRSKELEEAYERADKAFAALWFVSLRKKKWKKS
jgi:hypothetical protein